MPYGMYIHILAIDTIESDILYTLQYRLYTICYVLYIGYKLMGWSCMGYQAMEVYGVEDYYPLWGGTILCINMEWKPPNH